MHHRVQLGLALVTSHVAAFLLLVALTALDRFTFDELINAAALITPLFAVFTPGVVKWFFGDAAPATAEAPLKRGVVYLSWLICFAYVGMVFVAVIWKGFGTLGFDNFVKLIALIETTFAVYTGIVVQRLFGPFEKEATPAAASSGAPGK